MRELIVTTLYRSDDSKLETLAAYGSSPSNARVGSIGTGRLSPIPVGRRHVGDIHHEAFLSALSRDVLLARRHLPRPLASAWDEPVDVTGR